MVIGIILYLWEKSEFFIIETIGTEWISVFSRSFLNLNTAII